MKNPAVIVLAIALTPIVLLILAFAGTEANKAYWDWQVREMCRKEGGITVHEKVILPLSKYPELQVTSKGSLILPSDNTKKDSDPFYYTNTTQVLRDGHVSVRRHESAIVRKSDNKSLGKAINFSRVGGDLPTIIGHHSSYSCSRMEGFKDNLSKAVFKEKK